jgi:hypothetical protein
VYPDRHVVDLAGDNPSATYALELKEASERMERAHRRRLASQVASLLNGGPTSANEDVQKLLPNNPLEKP